MGQSNKTTTSQSANTTLVEILRGRDSSQPSPKENPLLDSLEKFRQQKELEKKRIEQFHQSRRQEWSQVYSAKDKETAQRLDLVRQQLRQLSKQIKHLDTSTQTAIESQTERVGEYHLSFLEQLQQRLHFLSQKVAEANTWLNLYNQRSKKKGHYWAQFHKKGSSFSLNQERQLATSVN